MKLSTFAQCLLSFVFQKSLINELVFGDNGQEGFRNQTKETQLTARHLLPHKTASLHCHV